MLERSQRELLTTGYLLLQELGSQTEVLLVLNRKPMLNEGAQGANRRELGCPMINPIVFQLLPDKVVRCPCPAELTNVHPIGPTSAIGSIQPLPRVLRAASISSAMRREATTPLARL